MPKQTHGETDLHERPCINLLKLSDPIPVLNEEAQLFAGANTRNACLMNQGLATTRLQQLIPVLGRRLLYDRLLVFKLAWSGYTASLCVIKVI